SSFSISSPLSTPLFILYLVLLPSPLILYGPLLSLFLHLLLTTPSSFLLPPGTQSANGSSFHLEMSQEGFSAVLTSRGPILGAVGAYDWSGGISMYLDGRQNGTWINATKDRTDMKDSYMGYAVQQVQWDTLAIGAPRYQHLGSVFIYKNNPTTSEWSQVAAFTADKIGSYFGSVLSILALNSTHSLLVVGSPTYFSPQAPGGRVYLCPVTEVRNAWHPRGASVTMTCPETLQGDPSQSVGHFGSAISV
ncbi:unnamed protein product, partial [Staurois parvus]